MRTTTAFSMRTVAVVFLLCAACDQASTRAVSTADLPPRRLAQVGLGTPPADAGSLFWCLQDDDGRVRLTGILRERVHAGSATSPRADTVVLLESPRRIVDCKNRAGGQAPRALEPRSLVEVRGSRDVVRIYIGDTVTVYGDAPAREALLDAEPLQMRLDSMLVRRGSTRIRVGPEARSEP